VVTPLWVDVVPVRKLGRPESHQIRVGGVVLPVEYRSRSEALRIAEGLYSLLSAGYEEHARRRVEVRINLNPPVGRFHGGGVVEHQCFHGQVP
jgi:hypothetical protein